MKKFGVQYNGQFKTGFGTLEAAQYWGKNRVGVGFFSVYSYMV